MRPNKYLIYLCLGGAALALLGLFIPLLRPYFQPLLWITLGIVLTDLLTLRLITIPNIKRQASQVMPFGVWSKINLEVENTSRQALQLVLHDHCSDTFEVENLPVYVNVPGQAKASIFYRVCPKKRGDFKFVGIDLLITSALRLWQRKVHLASDFTIRVYPNFREVSRYSLLATDNRLSQMGVMRRLHRGEGSDFQQLREYRIGDSIRQIDWKATSRYRKLISKEYRDERDQHIIFMLDCGRRMRHRDNRRGHLDQALNALLLLAHVAIHQGDGVGLLTFGGSQRWYPPSKGNHRIQDFMNRLYDLQATVDTADYTLAAKFLMPKQRRRALIVLITNSQEEDHEELHQALRILKQKHLVIIANLREQVLDEALNQEIIDLQTALRFQAVNEYIDLRNRQLQELKYEGHYALDILPHQLPIALVNQYLSVKASGRL